MSLIGPAGLLTPRISDHTKRMENPPLHIIFVHGFRGDHTSFQRFPTDLHHYVAPKIPSLQTHIYPTYKSRRPLDYSVERLIAWMNTLAAGPFILMGHSLGGFLVAEAAMRYPKNSQNISPVIGVVAFDVPYLGIHPHVIISGIVSLLPSKDVVSERELNDGRMVNMVDEASTESILDDGNVKFPMPNAFSTSESDLNPPTSRPSSPVVNLTPGPTIWQNTVHFFKKHAEDPLGAVKNWAVHHWEHGSMLLDVDALKDRYRRFERWDGEWVNFYTETVPSDKPIKSDSKGRATPLGINTEQPQPSSPWDGVKKRPKSETLQSTGQSNYSSDSKAPYPPRLALAMASAMANENEKIESDDDVTFPVPQFLHPASNNSYESGELGPSTALEGTILQEGTSRVSTPAHQDSSSSISTTRDVTSIFEQTRSLTSMSSDILESESGDSPANSVRDHGTGDPEEERHQTSLPPNALHKEKKRQKPSPPRRFILTPSGSFSSSSVKWAKTPVAGSKHEVQAHCGLFFRDQNLDYDQFVSRVGETIFLWCTSRRSDVLANNL